MLFKIPSLAHRFERNGVIALYNSLKLRPIFMDKATALSVENFFGSAREDTEFLQTHESVIAHLPELLAQLQTEKILLPATATEKEIIAWHSQQHTGYPYVSIMYLILTERCNLGCHYCFIINQFQHNRRLVDMTHSIAEKALVTFGRLIKEKPEYFNEEKTIIFYGGEPILNLQVLTFALNRIRELKRKKILPASIAVSLNSNGTLITREAARLLKRHGVALAISIDGDQWAQDACRCYRGGKSSYQDTLNALKLCQAEGVDMGLSCTLNLTSLDHFDRTLQMILNEFQVKSLGFNLVLSSEQYPVSPADDLRATVKMIEAFKLFRQLGIHEDRMLRKVDAFIKGEIYPFDCGATGGGQIVVAPDGRIGICHGYLGDGKYFVDHVDNPNFSPQISPAFTEWGRRSPLNMPQCYHCPALGICGGGCPMYADQLKGSIWELDERFCIHAKTVLEWLIWDLYDQELKGR